LSGWAGRAGGPRGEQKAAAAAAAAAAARLGATHVLRSKLTAARAMRPSTAQASTMAMWQVCVHYPTLCECK